MQVRSFNEEPVFNDNKVNARLILETPFSKELRISLKTGQTMIEHKTSFPILVHVLSGKINFGVHGKVTTIQTGDILSLEGDVPHDLKALEDSVVRLTISRSDTVARVSQVADDSKTMQ